MRTPSVSSLRPVCRPRPLSFSLARLSSAVAVSAALGFVGSAKAQVIWDGGGDGITWTDPLNWSGDFVPSPADSLVFGAGPVRTIRLNGNQAEDSLRFTQNFTLGSYGTSNTLTNGSGNVVVDPTVAATINAGYAGTNGLNLSGGGTLYLASTNSLFSGNIFVDGAGTTLLHRQEGPTVQYNGVNGAQEFGRFDQVTLGYSPVVRTITLTNGGEYKIINAGNNSEGGYKNVTIGSGGGALNLAAGYIVQNLDDVGQIGVTTETFTKTGKGRLILTGNAALAAGNPLQGVTNINGGMLSLDASVSQTVGANTYTRILGIGGTGTTLNINNGGTLLLNGGANFSMCRRLMQTTDQSSRPRLMPSSVMPSRASQPITS